MTGRNISHYEILEKLGAGGMGEIYKARDPRLNRTVAVKALPVSATADPERRRRFTQEAQAASGLNHPNIVTIHDILADESGNDYMVMILETRAVPVAAGLPVVLSLSADIPNNPESGTALKFTVKQDVLVNGTTVIAAGTVATGEVAGARKGLPFRGSKPTYRLISVNAVDGTAITLRATPGSGSGEKAERVIEPPGRKDKTLLAPAGTEYVGYIDGAHAVAVRK